MAVVWIHRYRVDTADEGEFLARRAALIAAMRAEHPGLAEARLIRLEDGAFIDSWRWDSHEDTRAALAAAPTMREVGAAMSLTKDATNEDGEIVEER